MQALLCIIRLQTQPEQLLKRSLDGCLPYATRCRALVTRSHRMTKGTAECNGVCFAAQLLQLLCSKQQPQQELGMVNCAIILQTHAMPAQPYAGKHGVQQSAARAAPQSHLTAAAEALQACSHLSLEPGQIILAQAVLPGDLVQLRAAAPQLLSCQRLAGVPYLQVDHPAQLSLELVVACLRSQPRTSMLFWHWVAARSLKKKLFTCFSQPMRLVA